MHRQTLWLALTATALAIAGCQTSRSGPTRAPVAAPEAYRLNYAVGWISHLDLALGNRIEHAALLDNSLVIVEEPTNLLSSISLRDGRLEWRHVVGERTDRLFEPYAESGRLHVNSETEVFTLEAATGRLIQTADLAGVVAAGPAVTPLYAVFGSLNGRVFAHDIATSQVKWEYQMPAGILVSPVAGPTSVFVADSKGVYAMFDTITGDLGWKGRTFGRISTEPVVSNFGVFLASEDQTLYALNRATGRDQWKFPAEVPLTQKPHIFRNTLLLPLPQRGMVALDARTGEVLWRTAVRAIPFLMTDTRLFLYSRDSIYVLDPATGKTAIQVPVSNLFRVLVGPDNTLVLVIRDGRVMRLDPRI